MDGTSFDLPALPKVALLKSLSFMSPSRLVRMSRTSEQSKNLIKEIKFHVALSAWENEVYIYYAGGRFSKTVKIRPTNGEMGGEEWREAVTEITQLFGTSLTGLTVKTDDFDAMWHWIRQEQRGVEELNLTVKNTEDPERVIKMVLDNSELKQLRELSFDLETSENFKYMEPFIFKNPPKCLTIKKSSWFTVQHLMESKVGTCDLRNVKFTDEEINFILKQWRDKVDCLSNLRGLTIFRGHNVPIKVNVQLNGFLREEQYSFSTGFRLTCGKEFYLEVTYYMSRIYIHERSLLTDSTGDIAVADDGSDDSESDEFTDSEDFDISDYW